MPNAPYQVSMPSNPRLLRVCNAIIADPSDPRDIVDWAALAAMGQRTFTRSFKQETGMGLAVWRQPMRLMESPFMLAHGASIPQVSFAFDSDLSTGFASLFPPSSCFPPRSF